MKRETLFANHFSRFASELARLLTRLVLAALRDELRTFVRLSRKCIAACSALRKCRRKSGFAAEKRAQRETSFLDCSQNNADSSRVVREGKRKAALCAFLFTFAQMQQVHNSSIARALAFSGLPSRKVARRQKRFAESSLRRLDADRAEIARTVISSAALLRRLIEIAPVSGAEQTKDSFEALVFRRLAKARLLADSLLCGLLF